LWFQLYQLYLQDPFDHLEGETDAEEVGEIQETMDENLHDQVQQAAQDMQPAEVEKPTDADVEMKPADLWLYLRELHSFVLQPVRFSINRFVIREFHS